jgi:hypothetical protein
MKKTILLLTFIIIFSVIVIADCPDGMVSYWKFEEDFNDDFSGSEIDSDKWTQNLCPGCTINAVNDKARLFMNADGSNRWTQLISKTQLKGDFDVQVDFNNVNMPNPSSGSNGIELILSGPNTAGGSNYALVSLEKTSSSTRYRFYWRNNGPTGGVPIINTNHNSGRLRIRRDSSTIYGYYWTGSNWILMGQLNDGWTVDVTSIRLRLSSTNGANNNFAADYDNFIINKGGAVYDSKGNNVGSNQGATLTTGKLGNALSFDGVSDYVNVDSITSSMSWSKGTISVWAYPTATGFNRYVFDGVGDDTNRYYVQWSGSGFRVFRGDPATGIVLIDNVSLNQWYHLIITWDNNVMNGYLNGEFKGSANFEGSSTNLLRARIGHQPPSDKSFPGKIDEVAIYKYALTAEEISLLYHGSNRNYNYCEVPLISNFDGLTTDLTEVADWTNIPDFTIGKSNLGSQVKWLNEINILNSDLDSNINLGADFVSLNVNNLHSSLNTSAEISFVVDSCSNPTIYYVNEGFYDNFNDIKSNGIVCPPEICSDITCNDNTLTFTAAHFDGFGGEGDPLSGDEPIPECK